MEVLHYQSNHPRHKKTENKHKDKNHFVCTFYPSRMGVHVFPFVVETGKVKGFRLKVADRVEYTTYDFEKLVKKINSKT